MVSIIQYYFSLFSVNLTKTKLCYWVIDSLTLPKEVRGCLVFDVFIIYHLSLYFHHSSLCFITYYLKMVGPMEKSLFGFVFKFCFHHLIFWFLSDKLWKLKTHFRCFQVIETELWCHFGNFLRNTWAHGKELSNPP